MKKSTCKQKAIELYKSGASLKEIQFMLRAEFAPEYIGIIITDHIVKEAKDRHRVKIPNSGFSKSCFSTKEMYYATPYKQLTLKDLKYKERALLKDKRHNELKALHNEN